MKQILLTLAVLLCCATAAVAQMTPGQALKEAEQKVKEADKHPKNGKMNLQAAHALITNELGEKKDLDRALSYATRAFQIAQQHPAPQDTLKGLSSYAISMIYLQKQSYENAFDYMEVAVDAFQEELGRYDPVTIGTKMMCGFNMMGPYPTRGYRWILEAYLDNELAPKDKRIKNIDLASIIIEMALERHIAERTQHFRYALAVTFKDGKRYFIVQTPSWNMERPLVGWMVADELATDEERAQWKNEAIVCDDEGNFSVWTEKDSDSRQLNFSFRHRLWNPRFIEYNDDDALIFFCKPDFYNEILSKYRRI